MLELQGRVSTLAVISFLNRQFPCLFQASVNRTGKEGHVERISLHARFPPQSALPLFGPPLAPSPSLPSLLWAAGTTHRGAGREASARASAAAAAPGGQVPGERGRDHANHPPWCPMLPGLFAPCDPWRPRAPRGAAGDAVSELPEDPRPPPAGEVGDRGDQSAHPTTRVILTAPFSLARHWNPALGASSQKFRALLEPRGFPAAYWLCLGAAPSLSSPGRPRARSTGSRGSSPARVNPAGCRLCPLCVLICGDLQGSRRKLGV